MASGFECLSEELDMYNEQKVLLRDKVIFSLGLSIKLAIILSINNIVNRFTFVVLIF